MNVADTPLNIFPVAGETPAESTPKFPLLQKEYLVAGEIRSWQGAMQDVYSPVCLRSGDGIAETLIGSHPLLTEKESLESLEAASRAYDKGRGHWPTSPVAERIRCVEQFAFFMKEKRGEIINLLMWEIGKSLSDSAKEFDRTIEYIGDTIHAMKDLDRAGSRFDIRQGIIGQIRRAPLGIVLCMGPFNYPLNETLTTLIPALITGNTVILKPPKFGALLFGHLLAAFRDAFPAGVVNVIFGDGPAIIGPLMNSGKIDVLAFIGSSRVADILKKQHPKPHRLRCVLGLDAKNAAIVLKDADIELAVKECVTGSLSFNGQRCTAIKIIHVQKDIADVFIKRAVGGRRGPEARHALDRERESHAPARTGKNKIHDGLY